MDGWIIEGSKVASYSYLEARLSEERRLLVPKDRGDAHTCTRHGGMTSELGSKVAIQPPLSTLLTPQAPSSSKAHKHHTRDKKTRPVAG